MTNSSFLFVPLLGFAGVELAPASEPAQTEVSTTAQPDAPVYEDGLRAALAPQPGGLTSDDVARDAVVTDPGVEVRRADLMATAASVDETISRFAPDLSLEARYARLSQADINFGSGGATVGALNEGPVRVAPCMDNPMQNCVVDSMGIPVAAVAFAPLEVPLNNYSLSAALTVPFSDYALRLLPAKRGAEANTKAAALRRDAEKVSVELQARIAYYDWLRSLAQVAVARQTLGSTRARLEDAKVGVAAGIATDVDVLRLDAMLASAEVGLNRSESFAKLSARNMAIMMGRQGTNFTVGEDVFADAPPLAQAQERDKLVEEAMDNRIELEAFGKSSEALEQARKAARTNYYPRLDGFADATYANPNQRFFPLAEEWRGSWTLGVSLSWRLSTYLQARSQVKQVTANRRVVEANRVAMERAIEMEVTGAWHERERALKAIDLTRRSAESATAAYDQQVALYQAGESTTTDIIEAEVERINATLGDVNARIDLRVAHAKLERATGRMKPMAVDADEDDRQYETVGLRKGGR